AGGGSLMEWEGTLSNAGGVINSSDSSLNLQGTFNNQNGFYIREDADLVLNLGGLDNRGGYLFHSGTGVFELNITGDFDNRGGQFGSDGSLFVAADNLFNDDGILYGKDRLELAIANSITNLRGDIYTQTLNVSAANINNDGGTLEAGQLTLAVSGNLSNRIDSDNNAGQLLATGTQDNSLSLTVAG